MNALKIVPPLRNELGTFVPVWGEIERQLHSDYIRSISTHHTNFYFTTYLVTIKITRVQTALETKFVTEKLLFLICNQELTPFETQN